MNSLKESKCIFRGILNRNVLEQLNAEDTLILDKVSEICLNHEKSIEIIQGDIGKCILKGILNPIILQKLSKECPLTIEKAITICENIPTNIGKFILSGIFNENILNRMRRAENSLTIRKAFKICQTYETVLESDSTNPVIEIPGKDRTSIYSYVLHETVFAKLLAENSLTAKKVFDICHEYEKTLEEDLFNLGNIILKGVFNTSVLRELCDIQLLTISTAYIICNECSEDIENTPIDVIDCISKAILYPNVLSQLYNEQSLTINKAYAICQPYKETQFQQEIHTVDSDREVEDVQYNDELTNVDLKPWNDPNQQIFFIDSDPENGDSIEEKGKVEKKNIFYEGETSNIYSNGEICDLRKGAKHLFGLIMRAHFGRTDGNKFQPCADDISILEKDPELLQMLRNGTLIDFLYIMYPTYPVKTDENIFNEAIKENNSIFSVCKHNQNNISEFIDLSKRAEALVDIIVQNNRVTVGNSIIVHLLDGHGRMLLCIIKAVMDKGFNPNNILKIKLFEINDDAHTYHKLVLPKCVESIGKSIIDFRNYPPPPNSIIYLNFCSIPPTNSIKWKKYFSNQNIENWVPACCKENVLKFIWKTISPPLSCTVMVSLIIKHQQNAAKDINNGMLYQKYNTNSDQSINGLGFIYLLRDEDIFDTEIVSIRPEDGIIWYDTEKRKPKNVKSGGMGHPFITLLVRPNTSINLTPENLLKKFAESLTKFGVFYLQEYPPNLTIVDLHEDVFQVGSLVKIIKGNNKGKSGMITERSATMLKLNDTNFVYISSCYPI